MLKQYEDRFSKSKLDLQTTTIYEASLPTIPGKIVQQKVRRLPDHKYQFALEELKWPCAGKVSVTNKYQFNSEKM